MLHFNLGITLFLQDKIFFALKELDQALLIDLNLGGIMIKKGFEHHLFIEMPIIENNSIDFTCF